MTGKKTGTARKPGQLWILLPHDTFDAIAKTHMKCLKTEPFCFG